MSDRLHDIESFDPPVRSILATGDRVQVRPTSGRLYRGRPGTITAIRDDAADVCLDFRGTQTYPLEDLERIDREFRVGELVRPRPGRPFAGSVLRVESIHRGNPTTYRLSNDVGVVTHNFWNDELERIDGDEVDGDLAGEAVAGPATDESGGAGTGDQPATAPVEAPGEAVAAKGADSSLTEPAFAVRDEVLVLGKVSGDIVRIDPDSETPYVVGDAFGEIIGAYHASDLQRVAPGGPWPKVSPVALRDMRVKAHLTLEGATAAIEALNQRVAKLERLVERHNDLFLALATVGIQELLNDSASDIDDDPL